MTTISYCIVGKSLFVDLKIHWNKCHKSLRKIEFIIITFIKIHVLCQYFVFISHFGYINKLVIQYTCIM